MRFANADIDLHIEIEESLLDKLYQHGLLHYPNEYGGLLIGHYSDDHKTAIVLETVLPKRYRASRFYFERGSEGMKESLQAYYKQEPKVFYLGEWHTHPDGPIKPSCRDKATMAELVIHDNVYINSPVLLILGVSQNNYHIGFYIQHKNKLHLLKPEEKNES